MIGDQSRGACLETVVTRILASHPRIIAVSATCPNYFDVSAYVMSSHLNRSLSGYLLPIVHVCAKSRIYSNSPILLSFGPNFRPVPIQKIVLGFRKTHQSSLFQFDQFLTKKILPVIQTYSEGRPTLIVCLLLALFQ